MSEFVNYRKRSVTLPSGCKDLNDLLQPYGLKGHWGNLLTDIVTSPGTPPVVPNIELFAGKISDIQKYVAMVFEPRTSRALMLKATSRDDLFAIQVVRLEGGISAEVEVQAWTNQEKAVRSFFALRGLHIPAESLMPPQFHPDLPWQVTFDISPLPPEPPLLSKFLADLLRDAFGLSDDSELTFCCSGD
jgi:hypothetical protein